MLFRYHNGLVSVDDQVSSLPEYKACKKLKNLSEIIAYIFFVYSRQSIYRNVLPGSRKKIVGADRFGDPGYGDKLEGNEAVMGLIEKVNRLECTPEELLLEGTSRKIEEYL